MVEQTIPNKKSSTWGCSCGCCCGWSCSGCRCGGGWCIRNQEINKACQWAWRRWSSRCCWPLSDSQKTSNCINNRSWGWCRCDSKHAKDSFCYYVFDHVNNETESNGCNKSSNSVLGPISHFSQLQIFSIDYKLKSLGLLLSEALGLTSSNQQKSYNKRSEQHFWTMSSNSVL